MRIALLIYGSLETTSGGYLYDRKLVEALERCGDRVRLISLPWRNYARHLGDNFSSRLAKGLAALPVDLLLQDELNHPSLFQINRRLRTRAEYPIFSIVHHLRCSEQHPGWWRLLYRLVERSYLGSVQGFIFNSRTTRQATAALLGAGITPAEPEALTGVIHAPDGEAGQPYVIGLPAGDRFASLPDEAEIVQRAHELGPLRVLFLGNVIPRKGLHNLIAAMQQLPSGLCQLTVAGSLEAAPAYARRVRQQATRAGLQDRVAFLGSQPEEALAELLRRQHVLAVPSSYEGYGIVYLEGMGFGLPAIGTTGGAAVEIITHAQDGWLTPPEDPAALAQALQQLSDRSVLQACSLRARERYRQQPTWDQSGLGIRNFLVDFLERYQ